MWRWIIQPVAERKLSSMLSALKGKTFLYHLSFRTRGLVINSCLLTSILQSKRSKAGLGSVKVVDSFLRQKTARSASNTRDYSSMLCYIMDQKTAYMTVHCTSFPVQHEEQDGDDDPSQQSQTNCEAGRQLICRDTDTQEMQHFYINTFFHHNTSLATNLITTSVPKHLSGISYCTKIQEEKKTPGGVNDV